VTLKFSVFDVTPAEVTMFTVLLPGTAPLGTVAVIDVADHEVTAAVDEPKSTVPVVEPKLVPVSVKEDPAAP